MGGAAGGAGSRPPALPRPGRRGRSVGTARRAHLAGSHPSARRGARWERGPGRRGLSALTGRAAEAPARRRSASRPSRASRASYSGDEEPSRHPAQIAAAAGRLHCLTITRAGFSPRIPRLLLPFSHCGPCLCLFFWNVLGVLTSVTVTCKSKRHVSLEDKSSFLTIKKEDCRSDTCIGNPHQEGLTHLDPRRWLPGRLLSDVQEAGCHCDSARGGSW
ncbi:zinc finger protein 664 isoform X5 [Balaenoptera acutorostrata]|uniref:Zinc finger protein 664 isoform X5 n=1 Tax=Balaenoptera acutorostrata TaxID=9767 RepID=A0ABM3S0I5_BALAC|nr:zinc finger protein 664 isoform X5 [Balaenoptera acutorostrata]